MSANPYEFDDESTITAEELQKAMQDRQVYLAEVKKRAEDFKASKTVSTPASAPIKIASANPAKKGSFNF